MAGKIILVIGVLTLVFAPVILIFRGVDLSATMICAYGWGPGLVVGLFLGILRGIGWMHEKYNLPWE